MLLAELNYLVCFQLLEYSTIKQHEMEIELWHQLKEQCQIFF